MDITLSAITSDRQLGKAMRRSADFLRCAFSAGKEIDTTDLPYDCIQIIFMDRDQSYLRAAPLIDRIHQIEISSPDKSVIDYSSTIEMEKEFVSKMKQALAVSGLPDEMRREIESNLDECLL